MAALHGTDPWAAFDHWNGTDWQQEGLDIANYQPTTTVVAIRGNNAEVFAVGWSGFLYKWAP